MKKKTIKQSLADIEQRLKKIEEQLANKTILDRPYAPMPPYQPYTPEDYNSTKYKLKPPYSSNIICPKCGCDTGIGMILNMVIPTEGLACPKCGATVVQGSTITCEGPIGQGGSTQSYTATPSQKYTWTGNGLAMDCKTT